MENAGPPAALVFGLRLEIAGVGGLIVNVTKFDVAPPAFTTDTLAVPAAAIRFAVTDAVN
jgi:hypothetical protein